MTSSGLVLVGGYGSTTTLELLGSGALSMSAFLSTMTMVFRPCDSTVRAKGPALLNQHLHLHNDPHWRRHLRLRNLGHGVIQPLPRWQHALLQLVGGFKYFRRCHLKAAATTTEGPLYARLWKVNMLICFQSAFVRSCKISGPLLVK